AVVKNPEACTACMLCELRCPDFAIEVFTDQEGEG
ncbi:MAG: 4Fe-4S ferredoxin, partial [Candidatus Zixiibacteriota bacterium]